tara:strand:+ start:873 stop:2024 length:1152 start_codon:yes stop_codon:yes gene_type:complete
MLTSGINFINFKKKGNISKIKKRLTELFKEKTQILKSLSKDYKDSFKYQKQIKLKKKLNFRLIGVGGSSLGSQAIYNFLKKKIKKNFHFVDNLTPEQKLDKKKFINIIISKSGNTIEVIGNTNVLIKKNQKNVFITENKKSYLYLLAQKLKSDIIHHNNFIGGRYSVLSEVGMLPADLMGLNVNKFRQFNALIKNKNFLNHLVQNVSSLQQLINKKKHNSVILNYDEKSESLFKWYQQLVAESLGKKKKGVLPIISSMPKDNHSVMQLYLDGFQNNFFTFFYVHNENSKKINNNSLLNSHIFLKNKNISNIIYAQKLATEKVFSNKNIPFRSFEIKRRDEKTLGELFCFFILETILLGRSLNINPFDQPAVELIKKETKKFLI